MTNNIQQETEHCLQHDKTATRLQPSSEKAELKNMMKREVEKTGAMVQSSNYSDNEAYEKTKNWLIGLVKANGLIQDSSELKAFITKHNINFMLISEIHFPNRILFRLLKYTRPCKQTAIPIV